MIRILLVEDSPSDEKLIRHALRSATPAEVVRVETADAFRAALTSRWDAIISDWSLPGFGALAALDIVRSANLDLPFVIASGTVGEDLAVAAMRAGAHDYVLKHALNRLAPAIDREIRESRIREESRRSEARFRAIVERSHDAIVLGAFDGHAIYASPAARGIFGVPPEDVVGKRPLDFVHADDRERVLAVANEVRATRSSATFEARFVHPDGVVRWVSANVANHLDDPSVAAVVVHLRDITDTRIATDALRASETKFARLAESGMLGILTADLLGRIHDANDAYLRLVGYTRDELVSGTVRWIDLIPADLQAATAQITTQLLDTGASPPFQTAVLRKDGTRVPILCGVVMGESAVCLAFTIDLSERHAAEQALKTSEEQLRQAQKMEAVGRLAGGIAHDFNNILSVIISYSELVMCELAPGDPKLDDLAEIRDAGKRAAELTRQLLLFSRQQVIEPKILDLGLVVAGMDKMLRRVVGEDVDLVTTKAPALDRVKIDPSSIEQVVMNLVVNARDAMPTGGRLTIETANAVVDAHDAKHYGGTEGRNVRLSVSDTGIGMDASTLTRIFEPFFTTKPKDKGTGLGLSTVFGIVQQAGGSVRVTSQLGAGTTFDLYLPMIEGISEPERSQPAAIVRGSETILIVEDDLQVRAIARSVLRRHGYHVLDAGHPVDALRVSRDHVGVIHLLVTDVVMPEIAGPELARLIANTRPTIRTLFMSGYTDDSIVRHGVLNAEIAFLHKPFSPTLLTSKVREVLDQVDGSRA